MKDLDFDELDRAVSSILGTQEETKTVETKEVTDVSADRPISKAADTTDRVAETSQLDSKTLIQKRSSGRFMDVVHPSSDMKSQNKPTVSRQAVTVAPLTEDIQEDEPVASVATPESTPFVEKKKKVEDFSFSSSEPATPTVKDTPEEVTDPHILPDPLDFHNFNSEDEVDDESETSSDDDSDVALEQAASELAELDGLIQDNREMPSLDTPFINDLAVEKRPLGAFSIGGDVSLDKTSVNEEEQPDKAPVDDVALKEEAGAQENVVLADEEAQLVSDAGVIPEELHEDVVAIESRELESPKEKTAAPVAQTAGSIAPQYKETPSTAPSDNTPIFDTTDYHKPLKHAEKKKSGWLGVAIIVALIIVGAGAGAAFYFFDPFNIL